MEETNNAVKVVNSIWEQLTHAPSHLLLLGVLLFLGMLIKKSPLPNWSIPWILAGVGAVVYPFIASPTNMDPSFRHGAECWVLALYGFMLGIGSIVVHKLLRKFAWFQRVELALVNAYRDEEDKVLPDAPVPPPQ